MPSFASLTLALTAFFPLNQIRENNEDVQPPLWVTTQKIRGPVSASSSSLSEYWQTAKFLQLLSTVLLPTAEDLYRGRPDDIGARL